MQVMQLTPEFQLAVRRGEDAWTVRCTGILDSSNAAAIVQPELFRVHEDLLREGATRVALEVQDVEYMNSSGLKSFMAWFLTAANVRERRYHIDVFISPARSWQQLSFRPMERLAPETVSLVHKAHSEGAPV